MHFYVENQAILEPILLYRASKCKQTKEQAARTVYGPIFLPFYKIIVSFFFLFSVKMLIKQDQTVLQ